MLSFYRRAFLTSASFVVLAMPSGARAEGPLGVDGYLQIVLRSHPGARQVTAFEAAARAERKAARQIADPTVAFSWDRATLPDGPSPGSTEAGFSVSQTLPWPGTFKATARAGDRAADALRAEGAGTRWELEIEARSAFARVLYARAALDIATAAEADARSLRDLTAKRAELGEAREVVASPSGMSVPLAQLADIGIHTGPAQISRAAVRRRMVVEANVRGRDVASFVAEANQRLKKEVQLPAGYYVRFGGQFENLQAATRPLAVAVPLALGLIFAMLYFTFGSAGPAAHLPERPTSRPWVGCSPWRCAGCRSRSRRASALSRSSEWPS